MRGADCYIYCDGIAIRHRIIPAQITASSRRVKNPKPKARAIILPGFAEFIEKHEETAARLAAMGVECLVLDWPGQGLSGRLAPGYPHLVHCDDFSRHLRAIDAVAEATGFVGKKRNKQKKRGSKNAQKKSVPLFLFGHSMGAHLALRFAARENPPPIAGIILTAPMMMPPLPFFLSPHAILRLASRICAMGFAARPVPGRQCRLRDEAFHPRNPLTRNPEGYGLQVRWWRRNPALKTTGPSFGWVRAAYASCIETTAQESFVKAVASSAKISAHLAGDEKVVAARYGEARLAAIGKRAQIHHYPNARHELLLEFPDVVETLWAHVARFIEKQIAERK